MRLITVGALTLAAALAIGLATPAAAAPEIYRDQVGDTYMGGLPDGYAPAVGSAPDISTVTMTYTKKTFTAAVTLAGKANEGWDELTIGLNNNPSNIISPTTKYMVRMKKGKITEAGRFVSPQIVPAGVKATISKKTVTVTIDRSSAFTGLKKTYFIVSISRQSSGTKYWQDDYPSRNPSKLAGGALVEGNPQYQRITLSSSGVGGGPAASASLAKKSVTKGTSTTVAIAVKPKAAGKAVVFDGKTKLGTVTVKKSGTATFTLPKTLTVGKHKIAVKFTPKGGTAGKKIPAGTLTVTKK